MRRVYKLHLYLGCLFAPLLIFFTVSGAWQTYNLHNSRKDGSYTAPRIVESLSAVHEGQKFSHGNSETHSSKPFQFFVLLMSICFCVTTTLGIIMALKTSRHQWVVLLCLALGVLLPMALIYFGGGY